MGEPHNQSDSIKFFFDQMRYIQFFKLLFLIIGSFSIFSASAQTVWNKNPEPVLVRSAEFPDWKALATADASVINHNDTLKMWFSGSGWLSPLDDCPHVRIGYAWSMDGIVWNEYEGNPVLDVGSDSTAFDFDGVETPTVLYDEDAEPDERFKMWYAGRNARCSTINDHKLGYAVSPNGIDWTKYEANPIFEAGPDESWFNSFVSSPSVVKTEVEYQMWFTAPDLILNDQPTDGHANIGYASSHNGVDWELLDEPVLVAGMEDNWDSAVCAEPDVIYFDNHYYMFYSALNQWDIENFQIGFAQSPDGVNWTKSPENPVLTIGEEGAWDRYWASHPAALYDSETGQFQLWYTGRDMETIEDLDGYYWDIGFASTLSLLQLTEKSKNQFHIYENPVTGQLSLMVPANTYKISLHNAIGQLVYSVEVDNELVIPIPLDELKSGIYIVSIFIPHANQTEKLFVFRP